MLIDNDWLRQAISVSPDTEFEAGGPVVLLNSIGMFLPSDGTEEIPESIVQLKHAFGVFIRMLRRQSSLTITALSTKARIAEEELRKIETDPHHKAGPRTVHLLAEFFDIDPKRMMKLSGAMITANDDMRHQALRFAAKSADLSTLSSEEMETLNEFVKYVNESKDLAN